MQVSGSVERFAAYSWAMEKAKRAIVDKTASQIQIRDLIDRLGLIKSVTAPSPGTNH